MKPLLDSQNTPMGNNNACYNYFNVNTKMTHILVRHAYCCLELFLSMNILVQSLVQIQLTILHRSVEGRNETLLHIPHDDKSTCE